VADNPAVTLFETVEPSLDSQAYLHCLPRALLVDFLRGVNQFVSHLVVHKAKTVPEFAVFSERMASCLTQDFL
jgi:hypothetical protein